MTGPQARSHGPRAVVLFAAVLAILFVIVPFLFWWQTWFGRQLTDRELTQYLESATYGRKAQHALVNLSERMVAGDASAQRWYPGLVRAAGHPDAAVRNLAAWTMGQDPSSGLLHDALRNLLKDPDLQVRRNAALSLVRFGDPSGRDELLAMLSPQEIRSPKTGTVRLLVRSGQSVGTGTRIATVKEDSGSEATVTAPRHADISALLVADGARLHAGEGIAALSTEEDEVWEGLRALYVIGDRRALPVIESYARGGFGVSERMARQARLTVEAIRTRPAPSASH